ncbi:MAG TPA: AMIN domain-containing protein [Campylobacterales bacterium]|nr:AMIN domain-containing protein [Campylobacterales bacterium]HIP41449.1 AMIN domain-containing protein [Campylobacterales bacterium]
MRIIFLLLPIIFLFNGCETGYKGEPSESNTTTKVALDDIPLSSKPIKKEYIEDEKVKEVKDEVNEGLDIGTIRVSQNGNTTRLVFDNYQWDYNSETLGEKVDHAGTYDFIYHPDQRLITAIIEGYQGFSAPIPKFSRNSLIEKIYFDTYPDENGYKFHIKLRANANVKVFDLSNPGRIVVDIELL